MQAAPKAPRNITPTATRKITTKEAADKARNRPQTWRAAFCRAGHFHGIIPVKFPDGRLLWDEAEVDALLAGRAVKTPDAADLDKHFERKAADASKRPEHIVRKAEANAKRLAALTAGEVAQ